MRLFTSAVLHMGSLTLRLSHAAQKNPMKSSASAQTRLPFTACIISELPPFPRCRLLSALLSLNTPPLPLFMPPYEADPKNPAGAFFIVAQPLAGCRLPPPAVSSSPTGNSAFILFLSPLLSFCPAPSCKEGLKVSLYCTTCVYV